MKGPISGNGRPVSDLAGLRAPESRSRLSGPCPDMSRGEVSPRRSDLATPAARVCAGQRAEQGADGRSQPVIADGLACSTSSARPLVMTFPPTRRCAASTRSADRNGAARHSAADRDAGWEAQVRTRMAIVFALALVLPACGSDGADTARPRSRAWVREHGPEPPSVGRSTPCSVPTSSPVTLGATTWATRSTGWVGCGAGASNARSWSRTTS